MPCGIACFITQLILLFSFKKQKKALTQEGWQE